MSKLKPMRFSHNKKKTFVFYFGKQIYGGEKR